MKRLGIIICARYQDCGGGKCFRALRERRGGFSIYPVEELVEIVGYPPCPNIRLFTTFIETTFGLPVVIGTHPIPQKYMDAHSKLPFWKEHNMAEIAQQLIIESEEIKTAYN